MPLDGDSHAAHPGVRQFGAVQAEARQPGALSH